MIARIWHGRTLADKADDYLDYVKRWKARYYPEDEAFLLELEDEVAHCDVVYQP